MLLLLTLIAFSFGSLNAEMTDVVAFRNDSIILRINVTAMDASSASQITALVYTNSTPTIDHIYCLEAEGGVTEQVGKVGTTANAGHVQAWKMTLNKTPSVYTKLLAGVSLSCYAVDAAHPSRNIFPFFINTIKLHTNVLTVREATILAENKAGFVDRNAFTVWWMLVVLIATVLVLLLTPLLVWKASMSRIVI